MDGFQAQAVSTHDEHDAIKPVAEIDLDIDTRASPRDIRESPTFEVAPPTVGIMDAAARLGVSYNTLSRWIKNGYIKVYRYPSGRKRIPESEITRALADMRQDWG